MRSSRSVCVCSYVSRILDLDEILRLCSFRDKHGMTIIRLLERTDNPHQRITVRVSGCSATGGDTRSAECTQYCIPPAQAPYYEIELYVCLSVSFGNILRYTCNSGQHLWTKRSKVKVAWAHCNFQSAAHCFT